MIWVSFFRPIGIFEGSFNRLAAWWTAGEYCHCEIVFQVTPEHLMASVNEVYKVKIKDNKDFQKLCAELESVFFENQHNRKLIQSGKELYVSFSLIWGDQLRVRFLQDVDDPWFSTPKKSFQDIQWLQCNNISIQEEKTTLKWALSQISKPYNSSAAFFSWVPSFSVGSVSDRSSYFCSEFAAMCLVKMGYLKPLATHSCTPNHLADLICRKENTQTVEVEVPTTTNNHYVSSSSDEDISTIEAELQNNNL